MTKRSTPSQTPAETLPPEDIAASAPEAQDAASAPETPAEAPLADQATGVAETAAVATPAAPDAQGAASDPNPDANPPAPAPEVQGDPSPLIVIPTRTFPGIFLAHGGRARRQSWAPGFELVAAASRGRSGGMSRILTTGSRAGLVEWNPRHLADDLLADDWEVSMDAAAMEAWEKTFVTVEAADEPTGDPATAPDAA